MNYYSDCTGFYICSVKYRLDIVVQQLYQSFHPSCFKVGIIQQQVTYDFCLFLARVDEAFDNNKIVSSVPHFFKCLTNNTRHLKFNPKMLK